VVELLDEMRLLGWECDLVGDEEVLNQSRGNSYSEALHVFLKERAGQYDVIEYDHGLLPYPRKDFASRTLCVARVSLLAQHFERVKFPPLGNSIQRIIGAGRWWWEKRERQQRIDAAWETLQEADLINAANSMDRSVLVKKGIAPERIVVIPYGIDAKRRPLFDALVHPEGGPPMIGFVGTFDARKGGGDLPRIVRQLREQKPEMGVRLIGTKGQYTTAHEVLSFFDVRDRARIEVIPSYEPERLPEILRGIHLGIFPSYIESFGFGVIEMLAAGIPVVAYDAPGPCDILPEEWKVPAGDVKGIVQQVLIILSGDEQKASLRIKAKARSQSYRWDDIARKTSELYGEAWKLRSR
jgi:glycosyltransferase involved in cell wall biosynthesis